MTVDQTLKAMEVMRAFTEGKGIEVRLRPLWVEGPTPGTAKQNTWERIRNETGHTPSWDWTQCEYRVLS